MLIFSLNGGTWFQNKTITKTKSALKEKKKKNHPHDVSFVNSSDLVSPFLGSIVKGKLGDAA